MSVIEAPVTHEQVVIQIEQNETQNRIDRMIELVETGHWCRDIMSDDYGRHCAMGLIEAVTNKHYGDEGVFMDIMDALADAIPAAWLNKHAFTKNDAQINGGTFRGLNSRSGKVCSFNNIIENRQGIIDWFERAKLLA